MLSIITGAMTACGSFETDQAPVTASAKKRSDPLFGQSVFGEGGIKFLGGEGSLFGSGSSQGAVGIGVNSFLWRASLDTISFMPLSSADPFGGVIITDWYAPPEVVGERFKMTVYILGKVLRSDALKVSLFRQVRTDKGEWEDSTVDPATITNLENRILEHARQMKTVALDD